LNCTTDLWHALDEQDPDINIEADADLDMVNPDQDTTNITKTGVLLAEQLLCSPECCSECHVGYNHEQNLPGSPSHSLNEVLSTPRLAQSNDPWIKNWSAEQREKVFCGTSGADSIHPPSIRLAQAEQKLGPAVVHFDIDSVLAHINSPAVSSQGLYWYPVQRPVSDLRSGLHLDSLPVKYFDRHGHPHSISVPVHHVKHYTLGRVAGFEDASVYALFPQLYEPKQRSSRLSDNQF
jgi:hypothetical protein